MRIVVNYRTTNPGLTPPILTKWTKVGFTYIVVSRSFTGAYSDIWATVVEVQGTQLAAANVGPIAVDLIGFPFTKGVATVGSCTAYQDITNIGFGYRTAVTNCGRVDIANPATHAAGGRLVIHAYIMGFGFDPARI